MNTRISRINGLPSLEFQPGEIPWMGLSSDDYPHTGHIVSEVLAVLRLAQFIEPDVNKIMRWYQGSKIMELDFLTPEELVHGGRANEVIALLTAAQRSPGH
jgi:hypothetical protein